MRVYYTRVKKFVIRFVKNLLILENIKKAEVNPLLSEKDGKHPVFDASKDYFDINGKWIGA